MASSNFWYTPTTGTGTTNVSVSAATTNTDGADRDAILTFQVPSASKNVAIKQKYRPKAQQFGSTSFSDTGGTIYFTVDTEYDIVFRSVPEWITISRNGITYEEGERISSGAANGTFELTAAPNSGAARSSTATMNMGHYIGDALQQYYIYFSFTQEESKTRLPLTFIILTGGTINWYHEASQTDDVGDLTIQYKINDGAWTNITSTSASTGQTSGDTPEEIIPTTPGRSFDVQSGDVVQFRGNNATYSTQALSYTSFSGSTAVVEITGNIMSLVNSTGFSAITVVTSKYAFNRLFAGTDVITAEDMALPATVVEENAYRGLFKGCTHLTKSPALPATRLTPSCYYEMFNGCSELSHIRCYATSITAQNCTYNWVQNVASTGTFVKNTNMMSWTVGNSGIPTNWVLVNYNPSAMTKNIAVLPVSLSVGASQSSTTVQMFVVNCVYSSMTVVSGGSFPISVSAVQGNDITLSFPVNTSYSRVGILTITFYDTSGGTYTSTLYITQAASQVQYAWSAINISTTYSIYGTLSTGTSDTYATVQLTPNKVESHNQAVPVTITSASLAILNQSSGTITITNPRTYQSINCTYSSGGWTGSGSISLAQGDVLNFTVTGI